MKVTITTYPAHQAGIRQYLRGSVRRANLKKAVPPGWRGYRAERLWWHDRSDWLWGAWSQASGGWHSPNSVGCRIIEPRESSCALEQTWAIWQELA